MMKLTVAMFFLVAFSAVAFADNHEGTAPAPAKKMEKKAKKMKKTETHTEEHKTETAPQ